jgi:hypothetical protein
MSQADRIAKRMTKGWTSTLEMMRPDDGPPITSPHRRLTEWREAHCWVELTGHYPVETCLFNGKYYREDNRKVKRNGVWCIDRRLVAVK